MPRHANCLIMTNCVACNTWHNYVKRFPWPQRLFPSVSASASSTEQRPLARYELLYVQLQNLRWPSEPWQAALTEPNHAHTRTSESPRFARRRSSAGASEIASRWMATSASACPTYGRTAEPAAGDAMSSSSVIALDAGAPLSLARQKLLCSVSPTVET